MNARHALAALALAVTLPVGCRGVLGIERRELLDCPSYCADIDAQCTGKDQQYAAEGVCLAYCKELDRGDLLEPGGNTLACRMTALFDASGEGVNCLAAGPGGARTCGSNCLSYCVQLAELCSLVFETRFGNDTDQCLDECAALPDCGDYQADADRDDDTIQCRLFHLSSAAVNPAEHCPHTIGEGKCREPPPPECPAGGR